MRVGIPGIQSKDVSVRSDAEGVLKDTARVAAEVNKMIVFGVPLVRIRAGWWHTDCVSHDRDGRVYKGLDAIEARNAALRANASNIAQSFSEPMVGMCSFALFFRITIKDERAGTSRSHSELGVFEVAVDKVVREQFFDAGDRFH